MTLLSPALAWAGLAAVAVPILIHLLSRRRRKPLDWAAMQFLMQAFRKHHRRMRLQQWILLALRCLVVVLIGLALAKPVLEHAAAELFASERAVFMVVDNGLTSSLLQDDGRTALDHHVQDAVEVINALSPGDAVGIITAARPAQSILMPPSSDHASVVRLLRSLEPAQSPADLPEALTIANSALEAAAETHDRLICYLLSDFRTGSARLTEPLPEVPAEPGSDMTLLAARPAEQAIHNVRITAIEPVRRLMLAEGTDVSRQVRISLARTGGELAADVTRVRITGPDIPRMEPRVVRWRPGEEETTVDVILEPSVTGDREISLTAIIDDDRLGGDNRFHTIITMRRNIRAIILDRHEFGTDPMVDRFTAGQWLRRALQPGYESPIEIIDVEPAALVPADLRAVDVLILSRPDLLTEHGWKLLREFVDGEGLLFVAPPGETRAHQWTGDLTASLSLPWQIGLEAVDYPDGLALAGSQPAGGILEMISADLDDLTRPVVVRRRLAVDTGESGAQSALVLEDGSPLLFVGRPQGNLNDDGEGAATLSTGAGTARGLVVLMAVAPELAWTNLPSKPLMVPLVHEVVRQGLSEIWSGRRYVVGDRPVLAARAGVRYLAAPDAQRIPVGDDDRPASTLAAAGLYRTLDRTGREISLVAVNIEPDAGRTEIQSSAAVSSWLAASGPWEILDPGRSTSALRDAAGRTGAAAFLIILVVSLVVLETVLARRFSYAYQEGVASVSGGLQPTIDEHARLASLRSALRSGGGS